MSDAACEQDEAAGGRQARLVIRDDGTPAAASVALRCPPTKRRVYAYLRWTENNGTRERYLGDVSDYPDRRTALHAAWQRARESRIIHTSTDTNSPARRK